MQKKKKHFAARASHSVRRQIKGRAKKTSTLGRVLIALQKAITAAVAADIVVERAQRLNEKHSNLRREKYLAKKIKEEAENICNVAAKWLIKSWWILTGPFFLFGSPKYSGCPVTLTRVWRQQQCDQKQTVAVRALRWLSSHGTKTLLSYVRAFLQVSLTQIRFKSRRWFQQCCTELQKNRAGFSSFCLWHKQQRNAPQLAAHNKANCDRDSTALLRPATRKSISLSYVSLR